MGDVRYLTSVVLVLEVAEDSFILPSGILAVKVVSRLVRCCTASSLTFWFSTQLNTRMKNPKACANPLNGQSQEGF